MKKDIELVILKGKNVPNGLIGDPLRLGQVLLNLVRQCNQIYGKRPDRHQDRTGKV